jgi:serine/threonine-protein kinase
MGTPLYLAPEAIAHPAGVDARSDLYSLGALGYFLLTGQHVFEGNTVVEVCAQHLHSAPVPPSERLNRPLPLELEALVLACLEKDPNRRPESAELIAARLRSLTCREEWTRQAAAAWWRRVRRAAPSLRPEKDTVSRTLAVEWAGR